MSQKKTLKKFWKDMECDCDRLECDPDHETYAQNVFTYMTTGKPGV